MNCDVIRDLLILYADDCCSEESRTLVEEHLKDCEACRKELAEMQAAPTAKSDCPPIPKPLSPIELWKASLLQSILLYCSFALLVFGVFRESTTPEGWTNGLWAFALLVPVTGFLLSLANWYFLRLYPSRKLFSRSSLLVTAGMIVLGYLWVFLHYQRAPLNLFRGTALSTSFFLTGCVMSIVLCVLSLVFSDLYARLSGKE